MVQDEKVLITEEGLQERIKELEYLKTTGRSKRFWRLIWKCRIWWGKTRARSNGR